MTLTAPSRFGENSCSSRELIEKKFGACLRQMAEGKVMGSCNSYSLGYMMSTLKQKCYYPLILTGTINPAVFSNNNVVLTDAEERLSQYCETLTRFLSDSPFDPIIFAENSGYPFPTEEFCALAKQNGKRFEYLYVETSVEKTAAFGKSYGEAVLISQALQSSRLLQGQEIIYKITGRVYLENGDKICHTADSGKSEFLTIRHRCSCQTVFFKLLRRDYENGLLNLPDYCNEASGLDVEHAIYNLLHEKKSATDASASIHDCTESVEQAAYYMTNPPKT